VYAPCINILWYISGRSHSEPSLVSLPFVSPPCLAEHLPRRSSHAEGVPNTSSRSRWSSAPTLEAMNQRIYPPMLLDANPTLEDFEIFHPDVLNTTHTADNSSSISQAQPPCSQPMTSHSFHVPVEHAVAPFHAALQHRPNGSQLQSQDNDPDLSTNTFALSQSYDMWLG